MTVVKKMIFLGMINNKFNNNNKMNKSMLTNDIHKSVPKVYYQTVIWLRKYPSPKSKQAQLLINLMHVLEDLYVDPFSQIERSLKILDVGCIYTTFLHSVLPSDLLTYLTRIHHIRQILFQLWYIK